jgi:hypothetical protein
MLTCHHCVTRVFTNLKLQNSVYTYITIIATLLLFSWWSLCILPFIIPLSKTLVHNCPRCEKPLAKVNPFNLPSLKDEVV